MKKILLTLAVVMAACFAASAQKFALVDMEYILKQVPSYEMANEQLRQLSQRWQKEVEAVTRDADAMYKKYLSDKVFLTEDQVKKREEEIVAKEKQASELRYKYFGPEGELYKTMSTTLSKNSPKNAAISVSSTVRRRPTSSTPPRVSMSATKSSPSWAIPTEPRPGLFLPPSARTSGAGRLSSSSLKNK